jgi:glycosyltransferase involved in cell wall biosynthesis
MARILHLISHLEEGGTQRQLSYAISCSQTHEMEIASLIASPKEKLFPFFQKTSVPIHFLCDRSDFNAPEILPALKKLLSERKYSLIHCWLFQSIVQGLLAARSQGIPCVGSPRSMLETLEMDAARSWEKFLIRRAMRNLDLTIFPSCSVAIDFVDSGWTNGARARVIQNGVDTDYFVPAASEGDTILSIGRYSPIKAFEDFEWIAKNLQEEFPSVSFLVAGGEARNGRCVRYIGHVDDVRPVLGKAIIFVSTSLSEGMSNAVLEAQSMGIPVIARPLGSISEIVKDGITGILAKDRQEMMIACRMLLRNSDMRREMGKKARENMDPRFSIATKMKRIEALYSELL